MNCYPWSGKDLKARLAGLEPPPARRPVLYRTSYGRVRWKCTTSESGGAQAIMFMFMAGA